MSHTTLRSAVTGYLFSLFLSLEAYLFVTHHLVMGGFLLAVIVATALVQLVVQLVFFLHITERFPHNWNLAILGFTGLIVAIVVGGSLWIMNNLKYQMSPDEMQKYITSQDSL